MVKKLSYENIPDEIKKIATVSLGQGVFKSLFKEDNTYHMIVKVSDGILIGFSLYHIEERKMGNSFYSCGVIDAICVLPAYRGEGFGTMITFGTVKKILVYGVNHIDIVMKSNKAINLDGEAGVPQWTNDSLLLKLGFNFVKAYNNFYKNASIKYEYDCIFCGSNPCECSGILFTLDRNFVNSN